MTEQTKPTERATDARRITIALIPDLANLIPEQAITPTAKIHAAHAISHLAQAAASLTRLRRELLHPGRQP